MKKYDVLGMSCAACSAKVEKEVKKLPGVASCNVNLLLKSMTVEGNAPEDAVIKAVKKAGYEAFLQGAAKPAEEKDDGTKRTVARLVASIVLLLILMYVSMGYTMGKFPMLPYFEKSPARIGICQMLLAGIIMVINQAFFVRGYQGFRHMAPNMDSLVSLGSIASFLYSFAYLVANVNDIDLTGLYFDSSAMVLTLVSIGKLLELKAKGKTTNAIKNLINLKPKTIKILKEGTIEEIKAEDARCGDIFAVYPGDAIPLDGEIIKGRSTVDESILTGESMPVDKEAGDFVSGGTINRSGYFEARVKATGEDTVLAKIITLVNDATQSKAPIAKTADKAAGIFVPAVLAVSLVTLICWLALGKPFGFALQRCVSVLVISCPCALGLATPVAIMVGSGVGAKYGLLFKNATSLEEAGKAKIIALDKTGTITQGMMSVTDVYALNKDEKELLKKAGMLEASSEHPIAKAIIGYIDEKGIKYEKPDTFAALVGSGVSATKGKDVYYAGSVSFFKDKIKIPGEIIKKTDFLSLSCKTPVLIAKNNKLLGLIAVADKIKADSITAVSSLKKLGFKVVMITGDNKNVADRVGAELGIEHVYAGIMPDRKEEIIKELKKQGKVLMVGDGINDAPALSASDIGIAIGSGTDIAIDSADVVVVKSNLSEVIAAIKLSRAVLRNIYENLGWAFAYNIIGIPLAAGLFGGFNPMIGAAAMSISSFLVVSNALRLNFLKLKKETDLTFKKTIKIEGMKCKHCAEKIKQELLKREFVLTANVSLKKKRANIVLSKETEDDVLLDVIEKLNYAAKIK